MLKVQGYYDGMNIRPLDRILAKPNQKVIITIMDEFMEPVKQTQEKSLRGILSEYADPALRDREKGAWERAAVEKYDHL